MAENARKRLYDRGINVDTMKYQGADELVLTNGDYMDVRAVCPTQAKRRRFLLTVLNDESKTEDKSVMHLAKFSQGDSKLLNNLKNDPKKFREGKLDLKSFGYAFTIKNLNPFTCDVSCQTDFEDVTSKKLEKATKKLKEVRNTLHNLKRKFERHDKKLEDLREKVDEQQDDLFMECEEALENLLGRVEDFEEERKNDGELIKDLKARIAELEAEQLNSNPRVINLFQNGRYTIDLRLALAELKECNVSDENCSKVIQIIFSLAGAVPNRLPSRTTVLRNVFLTKVLINEQLKEILITASTRKYSGTLGSDETTKIAHKLQGYVYRIYDGNVISDICLGIIEVLNKSAAVSFDTLKKLIEDLGDDFSEKNKLWKDFLLSIKNTISDQASTQIKFNHLLQQAKRRIMELEAEWDKMTDAEKDDLSQIRSFFCQLHILSNCCQVVRSALLAQEKDVREDMNISEPAVMQLIKESSQYFGERASSLHMIFPKWQSYALKHNIVHYRIPDLKGHRFNIIYTIANCVYYLKDDLLKFIEFSTSNSKLDNIKAFLNDPLVLNQLHILAMLDVAVVGPLWRLIENAEAFTDIKEHALSLLIYLNRVKNEPLVLFSGELPFSNFSEASAKCDRSKAHMEFILEKSPQDPQLAADAIELVADELIKYFTKQFNDFLPGGQFEDVDAVETATVPRSNRRCESIFGLIDYTYRHAPNMRIARREIRVQAAVNKVFDWFKSKSPEDREAILIKAVELASVEEGKARLNEKLLQDSLWQQLQQERADELVANIARTKKERDAEDKVLKLGGAWKTVDQMEDALQKLPDEKSQIKHLDANLRYHKWCVKSKPDSSKRLTLTFNGKRKELQELIDNMRYLLCIAPSSD